MMALQLGPVIGQVGRTVWVEAPVSATAQNSAWVTLTTVTPPPGEKWAVLVEAQTSGGFSHTPPRIRIGSTESVLPTAGSFSIGASVSTATTVQVNAAAIGATVHLAGAVLTMPFTV